MLPSEWYENAPMSILEAYALGKPVIGARIGGIPELIRQDVTGIQFESGDVSSLAAALTRMLSCAAPALAEMGRAGRHWVEAEFGAEVYLERVASVYRDLGVATSTSLQTRETSA